MKKEVEEAFAALVTLAARGGRPTRHHVRPILLEIEGGAEAREAAERIGRLPEAFREELAAAVRDEISMAATEHVRSADPRYLALPAYDWEYTLEARRRLEARLEASRSLGILPDEAMLAAIQRADRTLADHRQGSR